MLVLVILKKEWQWKQEKEEKEWLGASFKAENFIPGMVIGFILGLLLDLYKPSKSSNTLKKTSHLLSRNQPEKILAPPKPDDEDLKMVCFFSFFFSVKFWYYFVSSFKVEGIFHFYLYIF